MKMKKKKQKRLSESRFGFRAGRGTVDAIFIVWQIIEKEKEYQVPLHFNFIDFKASFDTIWRKGLWKMLLAFDVEPKIVWIVEEINSNTGCSIVICEWFEAQVNLRQGCLLSPTLFNFFLEFVMKEMSELNQPLTRTDTFSSDIWYADDTIILSAIFEQLKGSTKLQRARNGAFR